MDTSYLGAQVSTIIGQLHHLFEEIGVPVHERESRESELFAALSETLHNQLRLVTAEKNELTEEAHQIIKSIRQMEAALSDDKRKRNNSLDDGTLKVYTPLNRCLSDLREKYDTIASVHKERFEQVKKLVLALESYSSHLEPSFVKITLPPTSNNASVPLTFDLSPAYVTSLDDEFSRVYEEYSRRLALVRTVSEEIVNLWAELGTPQAQTDSTIVKHYRDSPEQLGLHESDINRLTTRRDKLLEEKQSRERKVKELKSSVESLWDRLGVEDLDRKRFLAGTRGCGLRVINEFESELDRLNELKRQNLHLFVEDARYKLQELWDTLYFSEEEMLEFTPAFSDVYSDALLSAHEAEVSRLEALKEQRLPTLQLIEKHRSIIKDREDLDASSRDASRLMLKPQKGEKRDPGKLLREEKMRKRITKELPKVQAELRKVLERWEDDYGRPFLVHGERYLDELEAAEARPAPTRSKTPSVAPQPVRNKTAPSASSSRQGSVMRPPPPRAGSRTPLITSKPTPHNTSISSTANKTSPSRIPARVPLSTMKGNNSPERRPRPPNQAQYGVNCVQKMGPPTRAPPPKMRDLVAPPDFSRQGPAPLENWRCESAASTDSGPIRSMAPEDVYDVREHMSYAPPEFPTHPQLQALNSTNYSQYGQQCHHTDGRVISNASTTSQAISGSENWETYDDTSEPEPDASEAYYAKLKASRGKRATPEGGSYPSPRQAQSKKLRSIYENPSPGIQTFVEENGRMVPAGSDAGWTDEDAF